MKQKLGSIKDCEKKKARSTKYTFQIATRFMYIQQTKYVVLTRIRKYLRKTQMVIKRKKGRRSGIVLNALVRKFRIGSGFGNAPS